MEVLHQMLQKNYPIHYSFHKIQPCVSIQSQMNAVHALTTQFWEVHFNPLKAKRRLLYL